jgi:hypothetical protein
MKMNQTMLKVAVTTVLTVACTVPAFANPYSDVPVKHWCYQAVTQLSQEGILDGYSDGTFKGDKVVTRFEMAQVVAKAMKKSLNPNEKNLVDKLAREFATELNEMGIKVDGIQDQMNNMVKISGDANVRFFETKNAPDYTDYRARLSFDGKVSDNVKFNARLSSGSPSTEGAPGTISLDTANVSFDTLGVSNTVGREDLKLGTGFLMDTQMNGLISNVGNLKLFGGIVDSNNNATNNNPTTYAHVYGGEYGMNVLGAKVNADYLKDVTDGTEAYGANTSFGLFNGVTGNAEYVKNQTASATGLSYGVKFNKLGVSATYRNVDAGAFSNYSTLVNPAFDTTTTANGFKGMEYQYDRALDKNVDLTATYQDFTNKTDGTKLGSRASAVVNLKF